MSKDDHPKNADEYFILDQSHTDPARVKKERQAARKLKKSNWWQNKIQKGICEYCEKVVSPSELTMDHRVPIARGGRSTKGNIVACCQKCNQDKKLKTPVEQLMNKK